MILLIFACVIIHFKLGEPLAKLPVIKGSIPKEKGQIDFVCDFPKNRSKVLTVGTRVQCTLYCRGQVTEIPLGLGEELGIDIGFLNSDNEATNIAPYNQTYPCNPAGLLIPPQHPFSREGGYIFYVFPWFNISAAKYEALEVYSFNSYNNIKNKYYTLLIGIFTLIFVGVYNFKKVVGG
ncbi:MAG: hypothetical protein ABIB71_00760 [Candidatus Woesearchaeota archaeon]